MPLTEQGFTAYESIEVGSEAVGLSPGVYEGLERARITVEVAAIRYCLHGCDPTAEEGHSMSPSDAPLELVGQAVIEAFSAIKRDSGRNPILRVSYGP